MKLFALSQRSLEGREILGVEITDNVASDSDGKPVFLLMGLHHAREWPSGEHAIEFAYDLVKNYGSNGRITDLLKKTRVIVVPVVNVDGFEQSRKWGDLVDVREVDNGGHRHDPREPGNAYKRKNCRVADGQSTPSGCVRGHEPRWLRDRRRPEPQLRRAVGWRRRIGRASPTRPTGAPARSPSPRPRRSASSSRRGR